MKLRTKVALISGSGRGIGRAVALAYAAEGAMVSICSRTKSEIDAVTKEIEARGGTALAFVADVSKEEEARAWVNETVSRFGGVDILVNNAGVMTRPAPVAEYEVSKWDYTLAVNLRGPFLLSKAVLAPMMRANSGSIINVTSSLSRDLWANFSAYSVSKAALETFTLTLSKEVLSYGIRVNSVDPGYAATKITRFAGSAPHSTTPVFVYLASDESRHVTGSRLSAATWRAETKG